MNNILELSVRSFPVVIVDERTGKERRDAIVLTKQQFQAAQDVGQSSKELIYRRYNRLGYRVLDIGKAEKRILTVDLNELIEKDDERRKWNYLNGVID